MLPFYELKLSHTKPKIPAYPKSLKTVGDHLRKKRHDLGLFQKDVASQIGVTTDTITNWELNRAEPEFRYLPQIINFLGYDPLPSSQTMAERIKQKRLRQGLSIERLAWQLGLDPTTLARWERGECEPQGIYRELIERFLRNPDVIPQ